MNLLLAPLVALALFPTGDHWEVGAGPYGLEVAPDGPLDPAAPEDWGLALQARRVFDTDNPGITPTGETAQVRLARGPGGEAIFDTLEIRSFLGSLRIRPEIGDRFDLGLLLGSWDEVWLHHHDADAAWRLYSPLTVTLLGMSLNDMDDDGRLKYYAALGAGVGGEWIGRVLGGLGLQVRADLATRSINRWRSGEANATRHEVTARGELSLGWLNERKGWLLGAWAEQLTRWDPRDEDGRDGVDLQVLAGGVQLAHRSYRPARAQEPDVDALLALIEELQADDAGEPPEAFPGRETAAVAVADLRAAEPGEAPPADDGPAAVEAPGPRLEGLAVHWSEVEPLERRLPEPPPGADPATACTVEVAVDEAGRTSAVAPVECPPELFEAARAAMLGWRFRPFVEEGRPRKVVFRYRVPFRPPPGAEDPPEW